MDDEKSTGLSEPSPITAEEQHAMTKVYKWWRTVCETEGTELPPDEFRACLDAAFTFMMECETKSRMPVAPTRVQ